MSFTDVFVAGMVAFVLAITYCGIRDYVLRNARECARCGSMTDERGFCERCNK